MFNFLLTYTLPIIFAFIFPPLGIPFLAYKVWYDYKIYTSYMYSSQYYKDEAYNKYAKENESYSDYFTRVKNS